MFIRTMLSAGILLVSNAAISQVPVVVTVSPGGLQEATQISDDCPTFSWGQRTGANSYEVVVFDALIDSNDYQTHADTNQPVVATVTETPALSWTPSTSQCLAQGGSYLWFVRATTTDGMSDWSQGRRFEVDMSSTACWLKLCARRWDSNWVSLILGEGYYRKH